MKKFSFWSSFSYLVFLLSAMNVASAPQSGSVDLITGLNLVGIPTDPTVTPTLSDLLASLGTPNEVSKILRFNTDEDSTPLGNLAQAFQECYYDEGGIPVGNGCNAPVISGEGWFVYALVDKTINYSINLNYPDLHLRKGLNLVAFHRSLEGLDSYSLLQTLGQSSVVSNVQAFDQEEGRWLTTTYESGSESGDNFPVIRDSAYLVNLHQDLVITQNSIPVANAGPDQSVFVGSIVNLDGTLSSDSDNDGLAYLWSFLNIPMGSSATLSDPSGMRPSFALDLPGNYEIQLFVNDGLANSIPDSVLITIDPSEQPTFDLKLVATNPGVLARVYGSVSDGKSGLPVAGGFDCDGDQLVDSAFSSMKASPFGRSRAGEVALVFGIGSIGETLDSAGFKERILKISGDQPSEITGAEIWMDDVTGDGIGDLLICRQNFTPQAGREGAGALTIIIGGVELRTHAESLQYLDLSDPPEGVKITTFYGIAAYDRLGIWVRTGDVDGDTVADIVVGSDEIDDGNEANRGGVFVIRGGLHLEASKIIDLSSFANTSLAGHVARINPPANSGNYHFGATCQIADLDGNGREEVLAAAALNRAGAALRLPGAPAGTGQASGGSTDGSLFILWDGNFPEGLWNSDFEIDLENLDQQHYSRIDGATFNRSFGEEILGGLDYDNDGNPDLFIGDLVANAGIGSQSGTGHVFFDAQKLKGLSFNMNAPPSQLSVTLIKGPSSGSLAGDTAAHGDFNNDGIGDLVVGNPHDIPKGRISAGTMHVLYGQTGGWPAEIDLQEALLPTPEIMKILRIDGANGSVVGDIGDTLCYSATAADVDQDGYTDIIVNEMVGNGASPSSIDVGNLLLISGAALTGD